MVASSSQKKIALVLSLLAVFLSTSAAAQDSSKPGLLGQLFRSSFSGTTPVQERSITPAEPPTAPGRNLVGLGDDQCSADPAGNGGGIGGGLDEFGARGG